MIVMTPEAGEAELAAVRARLETVGVHVLVLPGELTTAIGAIGDPQGVAELGLEGMPGVDRVVPSSRPYKLASSELAHHEPTVVSVVGRTVGGGTTFALIAGMLPIALANGEGSQFRAPLGVAVIGGVITSTVLTLVAIPTFYEILDETRHKLLQLSARVFRGRRPAPAHEVLPEESR